jgi:hypothetical protein
MIPQGAQKGRPARPQVSRNRRRTFPHPPVPELPRQLVPRVGYVEHFDEPRTLHGKKRVSARWGWAGEKSDFFSSLPRLGKSIRERGHMHLKYAPRHVIDIAAQRILHHGEGNLVPGNRGEGEQLHVEAFLTHTEIE